MIRNLKALGLALVATLAMSAVAVSSASALGNITSNSGEYPKHLIGEDVGLADEFTVEGKAVSCHGETYTGELKEATNTIEVTPDYGETCQTVGSNHWNVTVTENGCKLHFEWVENIKTDEDKVRVKVPAAGCSQFEIHHYADGPTPHGNPTCTNTIHPQTAGGTLTATSITTSEKTGDILLHGTVELVDTTHGACSFGFTLSRPAIFHANDTTIRDKAGTRIHIG